MKSAIVALAAVAGALVGSRAAGQEFGVAAGYVRMPGRVGASQSDHGLAARLGVAWAAGSRVRLGVEGAVERLNEVYRESTTTCFLPGGGTGPCTISGWERDVGWSAAGTVRVNVRARGTTPYLAAGAGFLRVRTHGRQEAEDGTGNPLPNFHYDATFNDDALRGHVGAGVAFDLAGVPFGVTAEARATALLHNYSGGLFLDWSPSVLIGVRWRR